MLDLVFDFDWVPEGSLAGFWGVHLEVWPAPGAGKAFQNVGGFAKQGIPDSRGGPPWAGPGTHPKSGPEGPESKLFLS